MNTVNKTTEHMIKEFSSEPWNYYEERQLLPEPDFHLIALEQSGKLPNKTLQQLLKNADTIEQWLNEPKRLKEEQRKQAMKRQQEITAKIQSK